MYTSPHYNNKWGIMVPSIHFLSLKRKKTSRILTSLESLIIKSRGRERKWNREYMYNIVLNRNHSPPPQKKITKSPSTKH